LPGRPARAKTPRAARCLGLPCSEGPHLQYQRKATIYKTVLEPPKIIVSKSCNTGSLLFEKGITINIETLEWDYAVPTPPALARVVNEIVRGAKAFIETPEK
jgi:hypothetical protein